MAVEDEEKKSGIYWVSRDTGSWAGWIDCLYVGAICVAEVSHDPMTGKADPRKIALQMKLPGFKKPHTHHQTHAIAQEKALEKLKIWMDNTGLVLPVPVPEKIPANEAEQNG